MSVTVENFFTEGEYSQNDIKLYNLRLLMTFDQNKKFEKLKE